jgi:hypothetical protein
MNVRAKGHALERSDAKYIRENTAFVNVKTARYASKLHDDAKDRFGLHTLCLAM